MKVPFLEALEQMPQYAKYLKTLSRNKKRLQSEIVNLPEKVSVIIQVTLGKLNSKGALADLGASISLIPMSITKQLAFELNPSRETVQLVDRSVKMLCGEFKDISIQVGNIVVLCDFVALDMVEDPYTPLILGRDALKTLGALIDCKSETITIQLA